MTGQSRLFIIVDQGPNRIGEELTSSNCSLKYVSAEARPARERMAAAVSFIVG